MRSPSPVNRCVPTVLLLAACAGDPVKVGGLAPFDLRSEVWAQEEDARGTEQRLVLTNVEGWCDKERAAHEAFDTMVALEVDEATYCRDAKEVTQAWASAMAELWHDGAQYLVFQPTGDGGPEDVAVGDWGGDSTASGLTATLTYVDQDTYASYLEDWDEDAEEIDRCGVISGNELGPLPTRDLEEGLLTITDVAATARASGEFEGTFQALEGEEAPVEVSAAFDAGWCDLTE